MAKRRTQADAEREALRKELTSEVKRANARLQRLQAQIGDKKTWAGKKLFERLERAGVDGVSKKGYVRYGKDLSVQQMRAILKATQQFNASKTSRVKGIKEATKNMTLGLATSLDIDYKDASVIVEFLGSKEYTNYEIDNIKSEIIVIGTTVKEQNGQAEDFIKQINNYVRVGEDEDLKAQLIEIYNKYFRG